MSLHKNYIFLLALPLLAIDELVTYLVVKFFPSVVSYNSGMFFGSLQNDSLLYIFLILGVMILLFLFAKSQQKYYIPLVLIAVGAVSNIIDRIFYSGVIDYIHFGSVSTFNLADIYICLGALWYIYLLFTKD